MNKSHIKIQKVTGSHEEFSLISTIIDNLNDGNAKLVYADWLDEQGDTRRANFMRKYAHLVESKDLDLVYEMFEAEQELIYSSWGNITGATLWTSMLESHGSDEQFESRLNLAMPCLMFNVEDDSLRESPYDDSIPIGSSKMYGLPDLPEGIGWPTQNDCHNNFESDSGTELTQHCEFIAQLNFEDFAGTQAARFLPEEGLLSIFWSADGGSIAPEDVHKLLIFSPNLKSLRRCRLDEDDAHPLLQYSPKKMSFWEVLDIPPPDRDNPSLELTDDKDGLFFEIQMIRVLARAQGPFGISGFTSEGTT